MPIGTGGIMSIKTQYKNLRPNQLIEELDFANQWDDFDNFDPIKKEILRRLRKLEKIEKAQKRNKE